MSRKSSRRVKSAKQSKAKQSKVRRNKGRKVGRKSVSKRKSKSKSSKVMKGGGIGGDSIKKFNSDYLIQKLEEAKGDTDKVTLEQKLHDINTKIVGYGEARHFSKGSTAELKHKNLIEQQKNAVIQKQLYDLIVNYRNFQVATVNACLEYNKLKLENVQANIFESGINHPIYKFISMCADYGLKKAYTCIYETANNQTYVGAEMLTVLKTKIGELNTELEELEAEFEKLK